MASWAEIRNYIKSNYVVGMEQGDTIGLEFNTGNSRSQLVFVSWLEIDEPQVIFRSPFAKRERVSAERVLQAAMGTPYGVTMTDSWYTLSHVQLASSIDALEIDQPMMWVTVFADKLEQELGQGDEF